MRPVLALLLLPAALLAQRKPVILDLAVGDSSDSAIALAAAANSIDLDLKAVSTVGGDTDQRSRLAWRILTMLGRRGVALGVGAREPLAGTITPRVGRQFEVLTRNDEVPATAKRSAPLILDTVLASAGRVVIVAPSALTNVAMALRIDPRITARIEKIVVTQEGEKLDPAAAEIIRKSGVAVSRLAESSCTLDDNGLGRLRAGTEPSSIQLARLADLDPHPTLVSTGAVAVAALSTFAEPVPGTDLAAINCTALRAWTANIAAN